MFSSPFDHADLKKIVAQPPAGIPANDRLSNFEFRISNFEFRR